MDDKTLFMFAWANAIEIMKEAEISGLQDSFQLGRYSAAEEILNTILRSAPGETAEMIRTNKERTLGH